MPTLIHFLYVILHYFIQAVIWVIIANAIVSWLIAFDVVNMRNRVVRQIVTFLDAITRPILKPLRRIVPPLGAAGAVGVLKAESEIRRIASPRRE